MPGHEYMAKKSKWGSIELCTGACSVDMNWNLEPQKITKMLIWISNNNISWAYTLVMVSFLTKSEEKLTGAFSIDGKNFCKTFIKWKM